MNRTTIAGLALLGLTFFTIAPSAWTDDETPIRSELAPLAILIGEWRVDSNFRLGSGEWERTTATSVIAPTMGGAMLEEQYKGTREGRSFEARVLYGYSMLSRRLQRAWADSEHGMISVYEGSAADNHIAFDLEIELRGRTHQLLHEITEMTPDSFVLHSRRSTDSGQTWRDTWEAKYTRQDADGR